MLSATWMNLPNGGSAVSDIIGPAWMSTKFCGGTREPGPLTKDGHALLDVMADMGFALDLSHMDWEAAHEALGYFRRTDHCQPFQCFASG